MIETLGIGFWLAEGGIVDFHGFPYLTRSVLVRLPSGGLRVWSPVALTDAVRDTVERLGTPTHLVSPNKLHHLFLGDWQAAYPAARLWGPASTVRKCPDLAFEEALDRAPPADWEDAFLRSHWKPRQQRLAPWWGIAKGKGYAPLEWRLSFFRRKRLRAARDKVLAWNADKVVMAHGVWQRSGGRAYLERCFAWID